MGAKGTPEMRARVLIAIHPKVASLAHEAHM